MPRLLGWDEHSGACASEELLALVGLEPARYADRYPAPCPGGERQRVGVARALAADPPVLLMDEPFGAVDPIVRERLQNELLRLQEQLAKTILFVTHDIDEAIKMGDLVAVLQVGGRLAQFGTPDEILANPASDFVARFVGADRGLKRLALVRVGELELRTATTARPGDDVDDARRRAAGDPFPYLLLVDDEGAPIGWIDDRDCPTLDALRAEDAIAESPFFDRHTTLKDALSMLLEAGVQAGIVVDEKGARPGPRAPVEMVHGARSALAEDRDRLGLGGRPPRRARGQDAPALRPRGDRGRARVRDLARPRDMGGPPAARPGADRVDLGDPLHGPEPRTVRGARAGDGPLDRHRDHPARPVHAS